MDFSVKSISVFGYDAVITEDGIETDYHSKFSDVSFVNGRPSYLNVDQGICDTCIKRLIYNNVCECPSFFEKLGCQCKLCRISILNVRKQNDHITKRAIY
jgi:hypothetical protein